MMVHIDPSVRLKVDLDASNDNRVELEGGGDLSMKYTPQGDLTLTGRYTMSGGLMKYALPVIAAKEFASSGADTSNAKERLSNRFLTTMDTSKLTERVPPFSPSETEARIRSLALKFNIGSMGAEERGKQALYIIVMKTYLGTGPIGGGGGGLGKLNMGSALNSVLSSQINSLMGNLKNASVSVGIEDHDLSDTGGKRTDYSFRYSQRLFNNRFQIVIGGKVSTGENATPVSVISPSSTLS